VPLLTFSPPSVFSETFIFAVRFRLRLSDAQRDDRNICARTRHTAGTLIVNPPRPNLSSYEDNALSDDDDSCAIVAGTPSRPDDYCAKLLIIFWQQFECSHIVSE
jgi:hypothetical protein